MLFNIDSLKQNRLHNNVDVINKRSNFCSAFSYDRGLCLILTDPFRCGRKITSWKRSDQTSWYPALKNISCLFFKPTHFWRSFRKGIHVAYCMRRILRYFASYLAFLLYDIYREKYLVVINLHMIGLVFVVSDLWTPVRERLLFFTFLRVIPRWLKGPILAQKPNKFWIILRNS
jgi:hypothetical protein